jgi:CBS domain-containing protein
MKIESIMTEQPAACSLDTNLAAATALMWEHDCGALPIVDNDARVVGIVTDRDICMALGTRNQRASDVTVADVASSGVHTIARDTDIEDALDLMQRNHIRRLPVVDREGKLEGIVSISDVIRSASERKRAGRNNLSAAAAINALTAIGGKATLPAEPNGNGAAKAVKPAGNDFDFEE